MRIDKQDKKLAESRSGLGAMTWDQINNHIGVNRNTAPGTQDAGTSDDRDVGINDMGSI